MCHDGVEFARLSSNPQREFRSCTFRSREATAANGLWRKPKDSTENDWNEPLRGSMPTFERFLGLTPEAICCRRFATQENVQLLKA